MEANTTSSAAGDAAEDVHDEFMDLDTPAEGGEDVEMPDLPDGEAKPARKLTAEQIENMKKAAILAEAEAEKVEELS